MPHQTDESLLAKTKSLVQIGARSVEIGLDSAGWVAYDSDR